MRSKKKKKTIYHSKDYNVYYGLNAMNWCLKNKIKINPIPAKEGVYIEAVKGNKVHRLPELFNNKTVSDAILMGYIRLYESYCKDQNPMLKTKIVKDI